MLHRVRALSGALLAIATETSSAEMDKDDDERDPLTVNEEQKTHPPLMMDLPALPAVTTIAKRARWLPPAGKEIYHRLPAKAGRAKSMTSYHGDPNCGHLRGQATFSIPPEERGDYGGPCSSCLPKEVEIINRRHAALQQLERARSELNGDWEDIEGLVKEIGNLHLH